MSHPLQQQIARVRSQARRLLWLYALAAVTACAIAAVLVAALVDYLFRFQDHGLRLMCSLGIVGAIGWAIYRFGWGALANTGSEVAIARRVERHFPALADRLAASLEFLRQPEVDPQAGSAALRRAVILETASASENLNFADVLDARPTRRALGVLGMLAVVALVLVALSPTSARLALARLTQPFGDDAWPRYYHVEFRDPPRRLAAGQTFEVELEAAADQRLPSEVKIVYRYENAQGHVDEDAEDMQWINGTMVARKERVSRPFSYRAIGGDDQTDWISLEVVEPARVESLRLTLVPPAYTGFGTEVSENNIRALVGTRVSLDGTSTKKLRAASLRREGAEPLPLVISADGHGFSLSADAAVPFVVEKSGPYWIELVDGEGLIGGDEERFEIRALADAPPKIVIEQPAANVYLTPTGELPIRVKVTDDLALAGVELHLRRSDQPDSPQSVTIWRGPERAPGGGSHDLLTAGRMGETVNLEHRWPLAEMQLPPKTELTLWATAADYSPQTATSSERRITIITPQELDERLAQRQSLIFGELERALKLQQDTRGKTSNLEIQVRAVGALQKQDVDQAQGAELNQRQVKRTLTSSSEGVPAQIAEFMAELENNRLDRLDMARHMSAISDELQRLGGDPLPAAERELTSVIKAGQAELGQSRDASGKTMASVEKSLAAAGQNQDQVIDSLEHLLKELSQWESFRRFARGVAQLEREQQEVQQATKELAKKTLGRDLKDLEPQQQAELKKLANAQIDIGRRLERALQQMEEARKTLANTDPVAAATIADGLHHARQQDISGQMRQSAERVDRNQLNQASANQARIAADLDELLAVLANRKEQELTRLVKQMREAEQELAQLRDRQEGLRKQMEAAAKNGNAQQRARQLERLAREQRQLQEEAARMARRLERLQAERAGRSTAGAAGKMGTAGAAGESGDAALADDAAADAESDLEQAQQQLAERRRQAEADLAQEQVAKMEDDLKSLAEREQALITETQRLDEIKSREGRLTRAQLITLGDLARQQKSLESEVNALAEKLALAEVIHLALDGAARQMVRAADLLDQQVTGATAQAAEEAACSRLMRLLAAMERKQNQGESKEEEGGGEGGGEGGASGDGDYTIAQLKVLRLLQEDLNDRYRELVAEPERAVQELREVAAEQGKLADLAIKLTQPIRQRPEDDPENLPDVRNAPPLESR